MTEELPLPSLHNNGAQDPDQWAPSTSNRRESVGCTHPEVGDLVAWRYAAWLVHEIRPYQNVDLTDTQRSKLDASVARLPVEKRPAANEGAYARPGVDCGYRGRGGGCLGGDLSSGGASLSPVAGDLLWEGRQRRGGGLL